MYLLEKSGRCGTFHTTRPTCRSWRKTRIVRLLGKSKTVHDYEEQAAQLSLSILALLRGGVVDMFIVSVVPSLSCVLKLWH